MNPKKILAFILVMAMCCMMAFGQARDPKTGRFIKKKPAASAAWNKAHPRDAKTGKFIKKGAKPHSSMMAGHKGSMMGGHTMMGHKSTMMVHPMSHTAHSNPMVKAHKVNKKGIMAKIKAMMHKKKS